MIGVVVALLADDERCLDNVRACKKGNVVISRCHFLAGYSKTPAQTLICKICRYSSHGQRCAGFRCAVIRQFQLSASSV